MTTWIFASQKTGSKAESLIQRFISLIHCVLA
uniref:Uncharacterized protein n=1 Tax=Rhizophora mucronata TaxID=61149 RepID=A0A2P2Q2Q2_RHIMU